MKKYIKEIVKFAIVLTILANLVSYYKSLNLNKEKLSISDISLLDNTNYKIPENKPLLIHFWATWCPICKVEAPNIEYLSKDYEVLTIAVNSGTKEYIKEYLKMNNLTFKVYDDFDGSLAQQFNIQVYPTTFIYDKNKNLVFTDVGYTSTIGLYLRMIWASF